MMPDTTINTATEVFPLRSWIGSILPHWGDTSAIGGSDLMAPLGTVIQSMSNGVVTFAGWDQFGGYAVQIRDQVTGLDYYYAHMFSAPMVKAGQAVTAGTELGLVGNTGDAAGGPTHLHLGIGYGIIDGTGPLGGIGRDFDAVSLLKALYGKGTVAVSTTSNPTTTANSSPTLSFSGGNGSNPVINYSFSQGIFHLGISFFLVIIGIIAILAGLWVLVQSSTKREATSIVGDASKVAA